jgi:pilus assembly protein FimV
MLALGSVVVDASALSLGRLNVQSAIGEPLRAEIEVTEITATEADGLRVNIASADAFRAAGVPYNTALSDVRSTLQRRADGRYVVRLTSSRSVSDPFIDLLLEANWNTGRIVRDYTVLLDPPSSRPTAAAAAPTSPQVSPSIDPASVPPAAVRRSRPAPAVAAAPAAEAGTVRTEGGNGQQVTVRTGDTAGKIAGAYKPAEVSLDQMLVALLRANPDAFIGGNVNRMKAGAVLDLPDASQAGATPAAEARRTVIAQSRDFGDYRRRLAENAPGAQVAEADRQTSGKLQANIESRNTAATSPDKLTIAQARAAEDKLAQTRQAQENNARVAELSKNIIDLNKIQAAGGSAAPAAAGVKAAPAASAAAASPSPATPAIPVAAPSIPAAPVAAPAAAASAPAAAAASSPLPAVVAPAAATAALSAASAPEATASTPAAAAVPAAAPKPAVKPAPPPPPPETSFLDDLLDNPLMLGGAAIIVLLLGFLGYRLAGRRRQDAGESVFLESRLPKDSFFAASGGESVDTKNRSSIVSSLSYSPSQLDAGDVDPVAEADVYLAYGRDLQAEEILREALRINPERIAIHLKLLEIHAKRRDLRAYEALATDVHKLTGGAGNDWNRVVEMGKELDPGNPLYEAGVRPVAGDVTIPVAAAGAGAALAPLPAPVSPPAAAVPPPAPAPAFVPSVAPLDFDLDLSKTPTPAPAAPITESPAVSANLPPAPSPAAERFVQTMRETPQVLPPATQHMSSPDLDTDFNTAPGALETPGLSDTPTEDRTQPATLRANLPSDSGFIEFDMSALAGLGSRDPTDTEPGRLEPLEEGSENPHAIKLSLARELQALGDTEGARSLVEEVEAESSGDLKAQAKHLLAQLA